MDHEQKNELLQTLDFTVGKVKELADAGRVIGDPIRADNYTVFPVSSVSAGFAGGAISANPNNRRGVSPAGTGAKVDVRPLSMLVIGPEGVKLLGVETPEEPSPAGGIVSGLISKVTEHFTKDKTQPKDEEQP